MKRKIESFILVILVVIGGFVTLDRLGVIKKDFSKVKLVYENDDDFRYYYDHLSDNNKIAYTLILPELYKHAEKIQIPEITDEEFNSLMYALSYDNPDLICVGDQCELKTEGGKEYYCPTYTHTVEECNQFNRQLGIAVNNALSGVDSVGSDYDKELYIHDYICSKCRYVMTDENNLKADAYDALVEGTAVCEGYARAAQLLFNELGIENYLVTGDAANENGEIVGHMWNIIKINGQFYHLDLTWDDMDETDEYFKENHTFFNVNDEFVKRTHFNISPMENICISTDMNYYNVNGMLFSTYNKDVENKIEEDIYTSCSAGENYCEFSFTNGNAYYNCKKKLLDNNGILTVMQKVENDYGDMSYTSVRYINDDDMYVVKFVFS